MCVNRWESMAGGLCSIAKAHSLDAMCTGLGMFLPGAFAWGKAVHDLAC